MVQIHDNNAHNLQMMACQDHDDLTPESVAAAEFLAKPFSLRGRLPDWPVRLAGRRSKARMAGHIAPTTLVGANESTSWVCVRVGVAPYTGRFGRLRPSAYVVHGHLVIWKLQPDAYVQQGPHFSTQGKNNSWQKVISPCRRQQVTGIATYLHEHISIK